MPSKTEKFAELDTLSNTFAFHFEKLKEGFSLKGKWHAEFFKNENPVTLELGCGKGEYTIGLATTHPERNYIGMDLKGNRIWTGAKQAIEKKLDNVAFLRSRIDFIEYCFAPGEIDEIWITFPDPQPQKTRERKRLTNLRFLTRYSRILKPGGIIHLKTDSTSLYEYTLEVIRENSFPILFETADLYNNCPSGREELISIKTYYEALFTAKGERIKYLAFRIN